MRWLSIGLLALAGLSPVLGTGQESHPSVDARMGAAVRVISTSGDAAAGSGALTDPRGYVLTSFGAVGRRDASSGMPGSLLEPTNRYLVWVPAGAGAGRTRWIARVVRGDVRLDLALLRIDTDLGGRPATGVRFPTMPVGSAATTAIQGRVHLLGHRHGGRRPQAATRTIRRRERNVLDQLAWLALSGNVDGGFRGAAAVDDAGRIVGVAAGPGRGERVVRLRPIEQLPVFWLEELRLDEIGDTRIGGVRRLRVGRPEHDVAAGPARDETHWYRLPRERPLSVEVTPGLPIELWHGGRRVRRGTGVLAIERGDPDGAIAVRAPRSDRDAIAYGLVARGTAATTGATTAPRPAPEPPRTRQRIETGPHLIMPGHGPAFAGSGRGSREGARVVGAVVDAVTGRPVAGGRVVVASRDLDLQSHISAYLSGELGEAAFRRPLTGRARTNFRGDFTLQGMPPGRGVLAVFASGYRTAVVGIHVREGQRRVDLDPIRLTR